MVDDFNDDYGVAPDGHRLTDTGNAYRFISHSEGRVRYVNKWGRWIVYRGGRWIVDANDALVTEVAKKVARNLMSMAPALGGEMRDKVYKAAMRAESAGAIAAMIQLARGIDGVIVEHEDLDADPYILNCLNGTVDLRTGELLDHDPADLCTQQCPVGYDPEAIAPLWEKCLLRWQPDHVVREYLQREAGAGACGRQTETLSIHYGQGGNGKSKFFGAVQRVLGPYTVVPHKSLIIATKHEQHSTVIASLFRVRLAVASETSERDWLNESQVKNLTGGDRLSARRMREDEWEFNPTHTLVMFSNHRPEIRGTDEGMWRRVRLISWDVTIPVAERDEDLARKLANEASGILRWIVEGCMRYLSVGIIAPECIVASTADYRAGEDTVSRFIVDLGIVFERNSSLPSLELRTAHDEWCVDNGVAPAGHWKRVAAELTKRGAKAGRAHGSRHWSGINFRKPDLDQNVSRVSPVPVGPCESEISRESGTPVTRVTLSMDKPTIRTFAESEF